MAGQARQIALRKLEVAVLSHGAFQAQRNGFCALLSDVLACPVSAQMKPCDQDWGKENLDVSGAVPLPENNCIIPYMWYPVNEKTQYIVSKL